MTTPSLNEIPERDVLTVDGVGSPESPAFTDAVRALFAVRAALGARDDVALEGSYAQEGDQQSVDLAAPDGWHWRLLVPAPPHAAAAAVATAAARFGAPVVLRRPAAQLVAQMLHHGPYSDEGPALAALYAFATEQRLRPVAGHTEVYLNDPRTVEPAALRTLLRVPVTMPAGRPASPG